MTDPKQAAFLAEYKALCELHGLMFVANHGLLLEVMSVLHNGDPLKQVQPDDDGEFNASDWLAMNQAIAELSKHLDAMPRLELRIGSGDVAAMFPDFSQAFPDKR